MFGLAIVFVITMVSIASNVQAAGGSYGPYGPYAPYVPEDTGAPEITLLSVIGAVLYAAGLAMVLNAQKLKGFLGK
jgi:hypothetical protein